MHLFVDDDETLDSIMAGMMGRPNPSILEQVMCNVYTHTHTSIPSWALALRSSLLLAYTRTQPTQKVYVTQICFSASLSVMRCDAVLLELCVALLMM